MARSIISGLAARDAVLDSHEECRRALLVAARRALLRHLLRHDVATMDDIVGDLELPADVDLRCLGAAGRGLAQLGIIAGCGLVRSTRPNRNASPVQQWRLVDRTLAEEWLAEHRLPTIEARQLSLLE